MIDPGSLAVAYPMLYAMEKQFCSVRSVSKRVVTGCDRISGGSTKIGVRQK
jgi:hypothetical protein